FDSAAPTDLVSEQFDSATPTELVLKSFDYVASTGTFGKSVMLPKGGGHPEPEVWNRESRALKS
ncbi:hypothetical protein Csa_004825, partial [Cucumis sativus]